MRFLRSLGGFFALGAGPESPVFVHLSRAVPKEGDLPKELIRVAEAGASHIILSSYVEGNPISTANLTYSAAKWSSYSSQAREDVIQKLHDLGTKLSISSGGNLEGDYWQSQSGGAYGKRACSLLRSLGVDGIYFQQRFGNTEANVTSWLPDATNACREVWPEAIIMSELAASASGSPIDSAIRTIGETHHDHYFVRTYDLGSAARYLTYEGLIGSAEPGIIAEAWKQYGKDVAPGQFVLSKPYATDEAHEGYIDHRSLSRILCQASKKIGYSGGVMFPNIVFGQDLTDVQMLRSPCKLLKSAKKRSILLADAPGSEAPSTEPMIEMRRERTTTALETSVTTESTTTTMTESTPVTTPQTTSTATTEATTTTTTAPVTTTTALTESTTTATPETTTTALTESTTTTTLGTTTTEIIEDTTTTTASTETTSSATTEAGTTATTTATTTTVMIDATTTTTSETTSTAITEATTTSVAVDTTTTSSQTATESAPSTTAGPASTSASSPIGTMTLSASTIPATNITGSVTAASTPSVISTSVTATTIATDSTSSAVSTTVTATTTPATTSEASTSVPLSEVEKCKLLVKGGPGMGHYTQVCKDACVDYDAVKGILEPWCPNGFTAEAIAQCVLQQRPYCELV